MVAKHVQLSLGKSAVFKMRANCTFPVIIATLSKCEFNKLILYSFPPLESLLKHLIEQT